MADDGSPKAGLELMFIEHRDRLIRFFTARTRDPIEAEEIVQEIFLRLKRTSGPVADPVGYFHRVGLNLVVDRVRERARRARREQDWTDSTTTRIGEDYVDDQPSPFAEAAGRQHAERIAAAIATLPPGAGRVFRMHKLDGLTHNEVAARLGISRKGVEKHMATALRHLSREIGT